MKKQRKKRSKLTSMREPVVLAPAPPAVDVIEGRTTRSELAEAFWLVLSRECEDSPQALRRMVWALNLARKRRGKSPLRVVSDGRAQSTPELVAAAACDDVLEAMKP